jgi:hypothetical protein
VYSYILNHSLCQWFYPLLWQNQHLTQAQHPILIYRLLHYTHGYANTNAKAALWIQQGISVNDLPPVIDLDPMADQLFQYLEYGYC